jgi:DNA/RNA-binding domain of Phe-tRNA-synthetase-like protein
MKQFTKLNDSSFSDSEEVERKRRKLTGDNDGTQAYEKNFSDFGVQVSMLDPAYEALLKRNGELENLNRRLLSENEVLRRQLLDDQQDRVKLVMEIAKRDVYNDIPSLIENQERL